MAKLTTLVGVTLFSITTLAASLHAGQESRVISVPALGVRTDNLPGVVNYILIQFDRTSSQNGPIIQFNEINLGGGSRVGDEWKDGARQAVLAVAKTVGEGGQDWLITMKNRSMTAFTDGGSAGAAMAVGLLAAYRGETIAEDIAISGQITSEGNLRVVGGLPEKIHAAAGAHYRTIVVAREQMRVSDWSLSNEVAARLRIQLLLADTLEDAYQVMVSKTRYP